MASACPYNERKNAICRTDDDGILFIPQQRTAEIVALADEIWKLERKQAQEIGSGNSLREPLQFEDYLQRRKKDSSYTFRKHLRMIGGAIEE